MSSLIQRLHERDIITPPRYVLSGIQYETIVGSIAYGVADTTKKGVSDIDIYGFCIPFKDMVFPNIAGNIIGFGRQIKRFDQYQQHHIIDKSSKKEYDLTVYSIVKYFQLCMENNPNMIDSLFTPQRCVLYCSKIGNYVRENRKFFLHKGSWYKFKNYAFSQIHKMKNKKVMGLVEIIKDNHLNPEDIVKWSLEETLVENLCDYSEMSIEDVRKFCDIVKEFQGNKITKRLPSICKFGYDVKFGYNVFRLLNEVEQIMVEHDLDLQRNREQLKSIRRGEWKIYQVEDYFNKKEKELEELYTKSTLQHSPDEGKIKQILINCLEMHFGDLSKAISKPKKVDDLVKEIQGLIDRYRVTR